MNIKRFGIIILICAFIFASSPTSGDLGEDFYLGGVCAHNTAGTACTSSAASVIKVPGKNKAPETMSQIPKELTPKLLIVPAKAPVFSDAHTH